MKRIFLILLIGLLLLNFVSSYGGRSVSNPLTKSVLQHPVIEESQAQSLADKHAEIIKSMQGTPTRPNNTSENKSNIDSVQADANLIEDNADIILFFIIAIIIFIFFVLVIVEKGT